MHSAFWVEKTRSVNKVLLSAKALLISSFWLLTSLAEAQEIDQYQQIAAENNPGLKAKYKAYESRMEQITEREGLTDPTFSFGYFISPIETRVGPQRARFNLTQMFPWFGTLKARGNVAALEAEAEFHAFLAAKAQLSYQVAQAYYPLYELEEWIQIEQENQDILKTYLKIVRQQFENGKSPMVDVLRVEMYLQQSETQLALLRDKRTPLLSQFNALLNRAADTEVMISASLDFYSEPETLDKDTLLEQHPEWLTLQSKTEAAKARTALIKKEQMPKIGVGMDYLIVDNANTAVIDSGKDAWMPLVSLSLPIFGKKNKAAQKAAELMVESNALEQEALSLKFSSEYDRIDYKLREQQKLYELYASQMETIERSLRLRLAAYENTEASIEDILSLQQQWLTYQKEKATAISNYHIAWSELTYYTSKYE